MCKKLIIFFVAVMLFFTPVVQAAKKSAKSDLCKQAVTGLYRSGLNVEAVQERKAPENSNQISFIVSVGEGQSASSTRKENTGPVSKRDGTADGEEVMAWQMKMEEILQSFKRTQGPQNPEQLEQYPEETHKLINDARKILSRFWDMEALSSSDFDTLKQNVYQLKTLLSAPFQTASNSVNRMAQGPELLSAVIEENEAVQAGTFYAVKPETGHPFRVKFVDKVAELINTRWMDERIKRSLKAILRGPVKGKSGSTGLKQLDNKRNDLWEVKILGSHGVGNFRIGAVFFEGVFYMVTYTDHHKEKKNSFVRSTSNFAKRISDFAKGRTPLLENF